MTFIKKKAQDSKTLEIKPYLCTH